MKTLEKCRLIVWAVALLFMMLFSTILAHAQLPATVDEASIAGTFNQIAGVRGWGLLGAAPFRTGAVSGNVSAIAQGGGNIIRGKYHAEAGITANGFDFKLYTDGTFKGYAASDLGRQADIGLAIEFPDFDVGGFHATGGAGVFGRNAGAFGPPNARDDLENLGYDPTSLDGRALETLHPPPTGLSFKAGNSLNLLAYILLKHPKGFSVAVKAMPELAGAGDNPVHQLIVTPSTSIEVRDNVNIELGADIGLQTFNDKIERELATLVAVKLSF